MSRGFSRFALILIVLAILTFVGMVSAAAAAPVRLYLQNQTSPVTMTTRGTWTSSTGVVSSTVGRTKIGTATTRGAAEAATTNPYKYHLVRFISEPIAAQTVSGTLNWTIGALQSAAAMTANFAIHVTVVNNTATTVRGTLLTNVAETGNTWPTTPAAGKSPLAPQALTSVTAQTGDRIQIEIGYAARNTVTTSYTGTINYGGTGATDLTAGNTNVTTQPGWFEFSQLLFDPTAPSNLAAPSVTATSVGLTWTADTVNNTLGYNIYRDGTLIASNVMTGSYTDTTVVSNTAYNAPGYTVRGVNEAGESADSNAVSVTTPAVNNTVVGALSYSAVSMNAMTVTASYVGDDNASNTCSIIYSTSATFTPYNTAPAPARVGKSWVATLSGLNQETLYYVRATFNDTDAPALSNVNVDGSQSTPANPLMHKSANLGTKYGAWGTGFTCDTCHVAGSPNIKRIRTAISAAGQPYNGRSVSASDAAVYGANNTIHATSTQICEVCHSQPTVHKYNQASAIAHYNNSCTDCHKHNLAFKPPKCLDCHAIGNGFGAPEVDASSTHVKADGVAFNACEDCHASHADTTPAGSNVVYVPTNGITTMNYAYSTAPHNGRIRLGGTVTATQGKEVLASGGNIAFTATQITRSSGLDVFVIGDVVRVFGSTSNNRTFKVTAVAPNALTVSPAPTVEGGSATEVLTTRGTEAQICWNCHDVYNISEWGTNSNTLTGSVSYDYGALFKDSVAANRNYTSNWVTGIWRSGKGYGATGSDQDPYWYKQGAIQSTHTANPSVTDTFASTTAYKFQENVNDVADIRCSYCHDVHGTHNNVAGDPDTYTGTIDDQPYLRGTWLGNPYPEDGAPQYGMAGWLEERTGLNGYGNVPRATAHVDQSGLTGTVGAPARVGGFWIDQNSGNPVEDHPTTSFRTATGNAGLCDLCHGAGTGSGGTKDGTWTAAEIGAIDQVASENLWTSGFNGHANVVIGGNMTESGTNLQWNNTSKVGRNIYNRTVRGSSTLAAAQSLSPYKDMGLGSTPGRGYSYRASDTAGYMYYPRVGAAADADAASQTDIYAMSAFVWTNTSSVTPAAAHRINANSTPLLLPSGTPEAAANAQANYHTFSCSKCHNPHASRLPKLMITNCLDTNHNTWDNKLNLSGAAIGAPFQGTEISQWASAQNCHRVDMDASRPTSSIVRGAGWNKATPWLDANVDNRTNSPVINP